MSEEIDDLSSTYQDFKDQNEEEVTFLRNKVVSVDSTQLDVSIQTINK